MDELVSIIVPMYNCQDTIQKCLESIINQTYKNIEVILINDGSTDNTINIVEKYVRYDERIIFINKKNEGVSVARNTGIKKSSGSYIMFIDADDWMELNMIERMIMVMMENETDIVRCNHYINNVSGKIKQASLYELSNQKYMSDEIYCKHVNDHFIYSNESIKNFVMLLLVKRDVLINNKIFFDEDLFMMEDVLFYQQIFYHSKSIYFLDENLYHYVENENSETRKCSKYKKNIYGIIDTNVKMRKFYKKNNLDSSINIKRINSNHLRLICGYVTNICECFNVAYIRELIKEISNNKQLYEMINMCEYKDLKLKTKIQVNCLKSKKNMYKLFIFKTIAVISKIKTILKRHKL